MPKRAKEISARKVNSLKRDGRYAVGGVIGLYLRIIGQSRSWILRIKVGGKRRELGLGSFPEVSLAMARDHAWERRRGASHFLKPWSERHASTEAQKPSASAEATHIEQKVVTQAKTFEFCARTYVAAQAPGWKSTKHAKQWLSTLERYAFPVIGKLNMREISIEHVLAILMPIWSTKTETATRVRGRMESILDWAAHRGYRSGKNPASWDGNLKHELPSPTRLKKRKKQHHPALPYMRVGAFLADLRTHHGVSARALEWGRREESCRIPP